jgi:hypothetical protein
MIRAIFRPKFAVYDIDLTVDAIIHINLIRCVFGKQSNSITYYPFYSYKNQSQSKITSFPR